MPQQVVPAGTRSADLPSGEGPPLVAAEPFAAEPFAAEPFAAEPFAGEPFAGDPVDEPLGDVPDDEQLVWDRLAEDHPVPAADESDDDQGAYRGRRRRNGQPYRSSRRPRREARQEGGQPRRVGQLLRALTTRRAAVFAVAAGVLLIGSGVAARVLESNPITGPAPAPTTLPGAAASPGAAAGPGQGQGRAQNPSPALSATATPTTTGADSFVPVASHEAEAGEAGSHGQVVGMDGASGGQVVRLSGNRNGTFVRFTDVVLAEPGQYELTIFYFCDQNRTATISINNEDHLTVEFPSRGVGGSIGSVSVSTSLAADANTIWIGTSGGAPLSVDRIALSH